ncbi:UDP-N-acetylmuramate--L-alanine ligase [Butyrivibrio sp. VCB2006]|uniref:UDP-N-acetylmuramate--L-alanine ligase n=1 Tax=Butyrivibrio sp. VCB2006 TaxID=1280679 RepID=UPI00041F2F0D|nr:UDP-N-acetylmuramate--L-alanine ligase [Butyrivibrio sp. VCB2006]
MYQIDFKQPVHVYFMGIGGISMSGLAQILIEENFKVSGSDNKESDITRALEKKGVKIFYGQKAENIEAAGDIDVVVYTAAVHPDNPEFAAAKAANLPMLTRAELLGQIMKEYDLPVAIAGTHGKTTTTSMLSKILLEADTDPTLSIGGIFKDINGNIRVGKSEYFVTEACEYTNSFLSFFPKISVISNIDADHLDFFKDLDDIRHSFRKFAQLLPADGTLVINGDIDNVKEITDGLSCSIVTYGSKDSFDYYPTDITYNEQGNPSFVAHLPGGETLDISLAVPGIHNVYNALASIAVANILGISKEHMISALSLFGGTSRRFEHKGEIGGVTIIDDYAHHPTEIKATLTAAQNYPHNKIWCVFQPHTYTRTKALLNEFAEALSLADHVVLADIYAAREKDNLGISSRTLRDKIVGLGHECNYFPTIENFSEIEKFLLQNCTKGDLLITMGAGDVVKIGDELLGK